MGLIRKGSFILEPKIIFHTQRGGEGARERERGERGRGGEGEREGGRGRRGGRRGRGGEGEGGRESITVPLLSSAYLAKQGPFFVVSSWEEELLATVRLRPGPWTRRIAARATPPGLRPPSLLKASGLQLLLWEALWPVGWDCPDVGQRQRT